VNNARSLITEVPEVTVSAFSMAMGVKRPGYQLVSLYNPLEAPLEAVEPTISTQSCRLPDQIGIYLDLYVPLLAFTTLFIAIPRIYRHFTTTRKQRMSTSTSSPKASSSKAHGKTYSRGYNHARALSRQSLYSDSEPSSDDEAYGYDAASPEFGFGASYHTDSDGLPTPVTAASYLDRKKAGSVRRVSRVYLWDGGRKRADDPASGAPASRACWSLFQRARKLLWAPWIGYWLARSGVHVLLVSTVVSVWRVVWPSLALAALVWLWYFL
jgi:hypothetical protein